MTRDSDAALLIGDPALEVEHRTMGLDKIDLGEEWTAMTGLPFVYAAWTGRPGAIRDDDVRALQQAQQEGVTATEAIAAEYGGNDPAATARAAVVLRHNVRYALGPKRHADCRPFWTTRETGLAPHTRKLEFF